MDMKSSKKMQKRNKILIVDERNLNRSILRKALEDEYDIEEAENSVSALKIIKEENLNISLILLNLNKPKSDGFELLKQMNETKKSRYIPVIATTSEDSDSLLQEGYRAGVIAYFEKPFNIQVVKSLIKNIVGLYKEKNQLEKITIIQNRRLEKQAVRLDALNQNLAVMLGTIVEFRMFEGANHIKKVQAFTKVLGEILMRAYSEYHLTEEKLNDIISAASLHDVGKIMIPEKILLKPGKLTIEEFEVMKSHTTKGCEILESLKEYQDPEEYQYMYDICRYHHEQYDGSGYPEGLVGDLIPISAQLVSVAETLDALITDVVYRQAFSFDESICMILEGNCGVYSPKILECLHIKKEELREIFQTYEMEDAK